MALSMDGVSAYLNTDTSFQRDAGSASKIKNSISGVGANSTDEELTEAVESFESYMLEQVIKQVKDTIKMDEEDKDSNSQLTDYYMDSTIQNLASTMVKEYGGRLTEDLVTQMKRNYGTLNEDKLINNDSSDAVTNVTPEQASAAASSLEEE